EPLGSAPAGDEADLHLGCAQLGPRIAADQAIIERERAFETAADARAVDGDDSGAVQPADGREHLAAQIDERSALLSTGPGGSQRLARSSVSRNSDVHCPARAVTAPFSPRQTGPMSRPRSARKTFATAG